MVSVWDIQGLFVKLSKGWISKATSPTPIAWVSLEKFSASHVSLLFPIEWATWLKTAIPFAFGVRLGYSWTFRKAIERMNLKRLKSNYNTLRGAYKVECKSCLPSFPYWMSHLVENGHSFGMWCPFGTFLDFCLSYRKDESEKTQV